MRTGARFGEPQRPNVSSHLPSTRSLRWPTPLQSRTHANLTSRTASASYGGSSNGEKYKASLKAFTVLSPQIDPYRLDTPAGHRDAKWAGEQLQRFYGPTKQAHWRGLHYAIIMSGRKVKQPDGATYANTDEDWVWLSNTAGKAARWLGYIPFDRIIDQRNSPPIIHRKARVIPQAWLSIGLDVDIPDADDIELKPYAKGFVARQAFHFVIFGEKSSLEEILLPIAEEKEADLYLPTGEISDALLYQIARDAAEDGRPMVMFTVSDCDPAGWQMPVSIARKVQAFRDFQFPELRFEVVPVALIPDQVREHGLPEEPLKKGEKRAERWEAAFGVKQTEVDSLTTPDMQRRGILRDIVEAAFDSYADDTLNKRVAKAEDEWLEAAQEAIDEQIDADRLAAIREEAATKLEELREQIDRINEALQVSTEGFTLPPIHVPEPEIDIDLLDGERQALVSFDDDWVAASRALIKHKSYGKVDDDDE
jgi:hypothetical protein